MPLLRQSAVQVMPFLGLSTQSWFDTKKTPPGGWPFRDSKPPEGVISCRVLCASLGRLPKFGPTHTSAIAASF